MIKFLFILVLLLSHVVVFFVGFDLADELYHDHMESKHH